MQQDINRSSYVCADTTNIHIQFCMPSESSMQGEVKNGGTQNAIRKKAEKFKKVDRTQTERERI